MLYYKTSHIWRLLSTSSCIWQCWLAIFQNVFYLPSTHFHWHLFYFSAHTETSYFFSTIS